MKRLVALNVAHQTRPKALNPELLDDLLRLAPDIIILTEFVDAGSRAGAYATLKSAGLPHLAVSPASRDESGRWSNQVMIAARTPLGFASQLPSPPDQASATNHLAVTWETLTVVGLRAPMYKLAADWYAYWRWLTTHLTCDILIGDLNVDPKRGRARGRVLEQLQSTTGLTLGSPATGWSYRHASSGASSAVDHILHGSQILTSAASYYQDIANKGLTDHAALVVDLELHQ